MKTDEQMIALLEWMGRRDLVGLKKRGLWYRPKACGYTGNASEAGRYTREEAKQHEYIHDQPDDVTIAELPTPPLTLDLMHEAILRYGTDSVKRMEFHRNLASVVARGTVHFPGYNVWDAENATKEQRLEALLKTIGKYEN